MSTPKALSTAPALPPPSSATAAAAAPSRAEKAAALRAKILAKQGQRMAIVSGTAQPASLTQLAQPQPPTAPAPSPIIDACVSPPPAAPLPSSSSSFLSDRTPEASTSTSTLRGSEHSSDGRSSLLSPPSHPLLSAASLPSSSSSSPLSMTSVTSGSSSPSSVRSTSAAPASVASTREGSASSGWSRSLPLASLSAWPLLIRCLSALLGVLFAVVPGALSFSSFLLLLVVALVSPFALDRSASPSPSAPASPPGPSDASPSSLLPPFLSFALTYAQRAVKAASLLREWVDDVCLFVLSAVVAQSIVALTASAAVSSPTLSG